MNNGRFPHYYYPPVYYPYPVTRERQMYPQHNGVRRFHPLPVNHQEESQERQQDFGNTPYVVDIEDAAEDNHAFRKAIWTGTHLQVTLMNIQPGADIGLERHPNTDQFIRIEEGHGTVQMGDSQNNLNFQRRIEEDYAIMIPAGKWHNVRNTGREPLKLFSVYAPPEHPFGTLQQEKMNNEQ